MMQYMGLRQPELTLYTLGFSTLRRVTGKHKGGIGNGEVLKRTCHFDHFKLDFPSCNVAHQCFFFTQIKWGNLSRSYKAFRIHVIDCFLGKQWVGTRNKCTRYMSPKNNLQHVAGLTNEVHCALHSSTCTAMKGTLTLVRYLSKVTVLCNLFSENLDSVSLKSHFPS